MYNQFTALCNSAARVRYTPPKQGRKRCRGELSKIVREADKAGLSYGKYVAENDPILCAIRPNKDSSWTSPKRTLIEGLRSEGINVK